MFSAMRMVANAEIAKQTIDFVLTGQQIDQGWLWVKNLWMPDSPFSSVVATADQLKMIPVDVWQSVVRALPADMLQQLAALNISPDNITTDTYQIFVTQLASMDAYTQQLQLWSQLPEINLLLFKLQIFASNNGWFITPILAAVTQYLMTITQPQTPSMNATGSSKGTGQFMKYFFPLFSLYICSTYNAGFSIYWVTSNVLAWGLGIVINKTYDKKALVKTELVQEDSLK